MTGVDLGRSWIPETFAAFDRVVVDSLPRHAAAPFVTSVPVDADLVSLIGEARRGERSARYARIDRNGINDRNDRNDRNCFMFRGMGLGDLAAASICLQRARERNVGAMLER